MMGEYRVGTFPMLMSSRIGDKTELRMACSVGMGRSNAYRKYF
jgi:hypothetical protein